MQKGEIQLAMAISGVVDFDLALSISRLAFYDAVCAD